MPELKLQPGPLLTLQRYPEPAPVDATCRAAEFLFDSVEVDPAVTLEDIFKLIELNPVLLTVYRRDYVAELLAEAQKGAVVKEEAHEDRLEYLELYNQWSRNTGTNQFRTLHHVQMHGVGPVLLEDSDDHGALAGTRINWGVSSSNVRTLLPLPIRVKHEVVVTEDDMDAKAYGGVLETTTLEAISLGQVIHALLFELSWHGGPAEQEEFNDSLNAQIAEIDDGTVETESIRHEDLFANLDRPGVALMFDTVGALPPFKVSRALRALEDDANVVAALALEFGETVVVKEEYRDLTGRAFRKVFREAEHGDESGSDTGIFE